MVCYVFHGERRGDDGKESAEVLMICRGAVVWIESCIFGDCKFVLPREWIGDFFDKL